jgi:hypothetical protein
LIIRKAINDFTNVFNVKYNVFFQVYPSFLPIKRFFNICLSFLQYFCFRWLFLEQNFLFTMNKAPKSENGEGATTAGGNKGPPTAGTGGTAKTPAVAPSAGSKQSKGNRSRNNSFGEGKPKVSTRTAILLYLVI